MSRSIVFGAYLTEEEINDPTIRSRYARYSTVVSMRLCVGDEVEEARKRRKRWMDFRVKKKEENAKTMQAL